MLHQKLKIAEKSNSDDLCDVLRETHNKSLFLLHPALEHFLNDVFPFYERKMDFENSKVSTIDILVICRNTGFDFKGVFLE